MNLARWLLWIDCSGGLAVGLAVLLLRDWLSDWYGLPLHLVTLLGVANLAYGAYSLTLATRTVRPMSLVKLLASANILWAAVCAVLAIRWAGEATLYGLGHLVLEGAYVGGLGALEWRWRERLRRR